MRYQAALRPDLGGRTESPPPGLASRIRGNDVSDGVFPRSAAACPASDILRNLCKLIGDGAPALFKAHFLMLLHGRFVPMPGDPPVARAFAFGLAAENTEAEGDRKSKRLNSHH